MFPRGENKIEKLFEQSLWFLKKKFKLYEKVIHRK